MGYTTKKFSEEFLREGVAYGDIPEEYELISSEVIDEWRWGNVYETTFKEVATGKFYVAHYRLASGDGEYIPFEYEGDKDGMIAIPEVVPVEVSKTEYHKIKEVESEASNED